MVLTWLYGKQDFLPRLKDHILTRLLGQAYDGDEQLFTSTERSNVVIFKDRIYCHKVLCINYTTYDMRRAQDSLNPRNCADVMVLAHEDDESHEHPYWYARILGVFHTFVIHRGSGSMEPRQIDFLWVRWFGRDMAHRAGWRAKRLHRIGFIPHNDPGAFGFLDPHNVIRAVHLIPGFAYGQTDEYLPGPSLARQKKENNKDWANFYVNQ